MLPLWVERQVHGLQLLLQPPLPLPGSSAAFLQCCSTCCQTGGPKPACTSTSTSSSSGKDSIRSTHQQRDISTSTDC